MQTLNLPIQIIINRQVSTNPWLDYSYQINGVVPKIAGQDNADFIAVEENDFMQKHFRSSTLQLFEDACVSYYQNLMADSPQLYVISKPSDDEFGISPLLVTVDYNEAHAYSGSETQVHTCAIHPQLYRQIEDFVVRFYHYEKPYKRKRKSEWKEEGNGAEKPATTAAESAVEPNIDATLPTLDSLDANDKTADFKAFLADGVSEALKKQALRKLFSAEVFNIRDGLDDYDDDYTKFTPLGDTVTADMRHQMERMQALADKAEAAEQSENDKDENELIEEVASTSEETNAKEASDDETSSDKTNSDETNSKATDITENTEPTTDKQNS